MKILRTVHGDVDIKNLGLILPHEHLFTDLGGPDRPGYAQADAHEVIEVLSPYLESAVRAGVTCLVECSTGGVGRNIRILRRIADTTPIHIVAPTGVYREAFVPSSLKQQKLDDLYAAWVKDLTKGIGETKSRAGFIKMAVSDDGPTQLEIHNLKTAAKAAIATGAAIASHTINPASAFQEMDILEKEGLDLHRFIWVHANASARTQDHLRAVRRGAFVEFDSVGAPYSDQAALADYTIALLDEGYDEHILLSHDAGWYQPGQPDGQPEGGMRGYTALVDEFLPVLRTRGVPEDLICQLTWKNPANAFAMEAETLEP